MRAAVIVAFGFFLVVVVMTTVGAWSVPAPERAAAPATGASPASVPTRPTASVSPAPATAATSPGTAPGAASATATASPVATSAPAGGYSTADVARHATPTDCWIIVADRVYDVTKYLGTHPGGASTITPWCGKESTVAYETEDGAGSHSSRADRLLEAYVIGDLRR